MKCYVVILMLKMIIFSISHYKKMEKNHFKMTGKVSQEGEKKCVVIQ